MAATGAHDWVALSTGDDPRSAEALWWATAAVQGHAAGSSLDSVTAALSETGQPSEVSWPYPQGRLVAAPDDPPTACAPPPWLRATLSGTVLERDGREIAIDGTLAAGVPVIIALAVTDDFDQPDPDGVIARPSAKAPSRGNHAILAVGARDIDGKGRYLVIRNSWGSKWAIDGYALLPMDYLATHGLWAATLSGVV